MQAIELSRATTVVNFGGGSGGGTMAEGVPQALPDEIRFVAGVPTADGGSCTGDIRHVFGGPAVGDVREVLARSSTNDAGPIFKRRFKGEDDLDSVKRANLEFRDAIHLVSGDDSEFADDIMEDTLAIALEMSGYNKETGLAGHTYGNFVLTALRLCHKDDIVQATDDASRWLLPRAVVIPAVAEAHNLVLHDKVKNVIAYGEGKVDRYQISDPSQIDVWMETGSIRNFIEDDPRKVAKLLDEAAYATTPRATQRLLDETMYSKVAMAGPGSPITSLRAVTLAKGIGCALAAQQREGGAWAAVANNDTEQSTPGLTLESYLGWLEHDTGRPFSHVVHDAPEGQLPERVALRPRPMRIRSAEAIGVALVSDAEVLHDLSDPNRDMRAKRHTNTASVGYALQRIAPHIAAVA